MLAFIWLNDKNSLKRVISVKLCKNIKYKYLSEKLFLFVLVVVNAETFYIVVNIISILFVINKR